MNYFAKVPYGAFSCAVKDDTSEIMGVHGKKYCETWYAQELDTYFILSHTIPSESINQIYFDIKTWGMNDSPVHLSVMFYYGSYTFDTLGKIAASDTILVWGQPLKFIDILEKINTGIDTITGSAWIMNIHAPEWITIPITYKFDLKRKRLSQVSCNYPKEYYVKFQEHCSHSWVPPNLLALNQNKSLYLGE